VPVGQEPLTGMLPDQAPAATHAVALVEDQLSVELLPLVIELGLALKLTTGAAAFTDTVADCEALPPLPVQVSKYVALVVRAPVDRVPWVGWLPDHAPEAVQLVALVEVQLSVALPPLVTALGPTLKVRVGVGDLTDTVADCDALPPGPEQVRV
jgi:hypothetical protein